MTIIFEETLERIYNKDGWVVRKTTSNEAIGYFFLKVKSYFCARTIKDIKCIYIINHEKEEFYAFDYSLETELFSYACGSRNVLINTDRKSKNCLEGYRVDIVDRIRKILPEGVISCLSYINYWCKRYEEISKNNLKDHTLIYTKDTRESDIIMLTPYINKILIAKDVEVISSKFSLSFLYNKANKRIEKIEFEEDSKCYEIKDLSFFIGVKSIKIPRSVRLIGEEAFSGMKALEKIEFEKTSNLSIIGYGAFIDCKSLKEVKIPKSVKIIDDKIFWGCDSLSYVEFEEGSELSQISPDCLNIGEIWVDKNVEVKNFPIKIVSMDNESRKKALKELRAKIRKIENETYKWAQKREVA